jgi:hypothetical protein
MCKNEKRTCAVVDERRRNGDSVQRGGLFIARDSGPLLGAQSHPLLEMLGSQEHIQSEIMR